MESDECPGESPEGFEDEQDGSEGVQLDQHYFQVSAVFYHDGLPHHICHQFVDYAPWFEILNDLLEGLGQIECDHSSVSVRELPMPKRLEHYNICPPTNGMIH